MQEVPPHQDPPRAAGDAADRTWRFLDDLAGAAPTPGGGGAAALMAAMAAALAAMATRLTLGRPAYLAVQDEMQRLLVDSEALRHRAAALVDEDATAVRRVMAAHRLPRATPEELAAREDALQAAMQAATQSPLAVARACAMAMQLLARALEQCNRNARPDVGVGMLCAWAGLRGAALTAAANLPPLSDRTYAAAVHDELTALQAACDALARQVLQTLPDDPR